MDTLSIFQSKGENGIGGTHEFLCTTDHDMVCPSTGDVRGHIVFDADPTGISTGFSVSIGLSVALSGLHSVLNWWADPIQIC